MASSRRISVVLFLLSSAFIQGSLGVIVCENLPKERCAYAVSGSAKRCVLEKIEGEFLCRTSTVLVDRMADYIENEKCVKDCGLDRFAVGISSDSLLESKFTGRLCSSECYENCPNIVDLYFNLAAAEGVYLPRLCEVHRSNPHRAMMELMSNGDVSPGPLANTQSAQEISPAPAEAHSAI